MNSLLLAILADSEKQSWFEKTKDDFVNNFITDDRYMYIVNGLKITLQVTFFALLLGIVLGIIMAIIRSTHDKTVATMRPGIGKFILKVLNTLF